LLLSVSTQDGHGGQALIIVRDSCMDEFNCFLSVTSEHDIDCYGLFVVETSTTIKQSPTRIISTWFMQWSCSHFPLFKYMSIHMWTSYLPIIDKSRYEDELILMQATTTGVDHVQGFLHMVSLNLHSDRKFKIVSNRIANIDLRIEYIEYENHRKYSIVADCHRFIDVSTNCQSAWLVSSETYVFNCLFIYNSCCH
jgi:hypothetical protein